METELGTYLRALRAARGLSLRGLAARAGLAKGTLAYWEGGRFEPRLPELEAALAALGASGPERARAVALVQAPRAARALRAAERDAAEDADLGPAPAIGDLLRAMRRRAGRTPEAVAAALRVHPATVRRWEASAVAVPAERLDDLCAVLGATPAERAALAARRLSLAPPGREALLDLEAAWRECDAAAVRTQRGEAALTDLSLLSLEARLWPAARGAAGRRVLARALTAHATFLEVNGRGDEAPACARPALELLAGERSPEPWWFDTVHTLGYALAPGLAAEARARRRVAYLRGWLGRTEDAFWQTSLYRDMAHYASEGGDHAQALHWVAEAEAAAVRCGHAEALRLARHVRAGALLAQGRWEEVLRLAPPDPHPSVHQRYFEGAYEVEALVRTGEAGAAHARLAGLYALARAHGLPTTGPDGLARLFDAAPRP